MYTLPILYTPLACVHANSLQSCPTLCDPMDCSPPGSSVHGILQARLKWVAMSSSKGSSQPRDQTRISYVSCIGRRVLYHYCHQGSPICSTENIKLKISAFFQPGFIALYFICLGLGPSAGNLPA